MSTSHKQVRITLLLTLQGKMIKDRNCIAHCVKRKESAENDLTGTQIIKPITTSIIYHSANYYQEISLYKKTKKDSVKSDHHHQSSIMNHESSNRLI